MLFDKLLKYSNRKEVKQMAIYFYEIHNGLKGKGASHVDYIYREGHFTKTRNELVATGSTNLPWWADTPKEFFAAADLYERKNGSAYFSFDIALPKELTREQNLELARNLADYFFQDSDAYDMM